MAVTQLSDGRWVCYYRAPDPDGRRRIKKEYFGRGLDAENAAHRRNDELSLKKRRPVAVKIMPKFYEIAEAYTFSRNFNQNSKKQLKIRLASTIFPILGNKTAIQINDADMDKYVAKRRAGGVKNSTIRREITDIKAILNWAAIRQPRLISCNPIATYKKPMADDEIILPPTIKEAKAILSAAVPHMARIFKLSYYLGLRPGAVELLSLNWLNVNWENQTIRVMSAHKGGPVSRDVPLHKNLLHDMKTWHKKDKKKGPIIHYHGKPIKKFQTSWKGALGRAGITRRLRPYDLRHFFITHALENGADIKALSEIVGSRPETLMRHYQHVTTELRRQTIAKIPNLGDTVSLKKQKGRNKQTPLTS
jgi:integrase